MGCAHMMKSLPPTPPATPITFSPAPTSQSPVGLPQIWPPHCSFHSLIVPPLRMRPRSLQGGQASQAQPLTPSLPLKPLYTHFSLPLWAHCARPWPGSPGAPCPPGAALPALHTPHFSSAQLSAPTAHGAIITCTLPTCWLGLETTGSRGQVQVIRVPRTQQRALVSAAKHVREGLCAYVDPMCHYQELK